MYDHLFQRVGDSEAHKVHGWWAFVVACEYAYMTGDSFHWMYGLFEEIIDLNRVEDFLRKHREADSYCAPDLSTWNIEESVFGKPYPGLRGNSTSITPEMLEEHGVRYELLDKDDRVVIAGKYIEGDDDYPHNRNLGKYDPWDCFMSFPLLGIVKYRIVQPEDVQG